jgi:curved DNA-binding protein CbpA
MVENRALTTDEIGLLASLIIDEADHYTVLGVDRNASNEDIRNAYCIAVEYFHPLKSREVTESDRVMHWKLSSAFVRIEEAFAILSSHSRRSVYDEKLNCQPMTSFPNEPTNDEFWWLRRSERSDLARATLEPPVAKPVTIERRRVERVPLSLPLRVTFERQWQELTHTEDVSPLGIRFRLSRRLEPGSQLRLDLPLPKHLRSHSWNDELYVVNAFAIHVSRNNRKWRVVAEFIL